jgi:hypothetical protein
VIDMESGGSGGSQKGVAANPNSLLGDRSRERSLLLTSWAGDR